MKLFCLFICIFALSLSACATESGYYFEKYLPSAYDSNGFVHSNSNSQVDLSLYMAELNRRVKMNWDKPRNTANCETVLDIKVLSNGTLQEVTVFKSSGNISMDKSCILAVNLAQPFRPLPSEFKGSSIEVQITFSAGINKPIAHVLLAPN